ncbi:hypothetical protein JCM5350_004329 [Sporobolomyces pararoseus]
MVPNSVSQASSAPLSFLPFPTSPTLLNPSTGVWPGTPSFWRDVGWDPDSQEELPAYFLPPPELDLSTLKPNEQLSQNPPLQTEFQTREQTPSTSSSSRQSQPLSHRPPLPPPPPPPPSPPQEAHSTADTTNTSNQGSSATPLLEEPQIPTWDEIILELAAEGDGGPPRRGGSEIIMICPWWDSSVGEGGWDKVRATYLPWRKWLQRLVFSELRFKPGSYRLITPIIFCSATTPLADLPVHSYLPPQFRIQTLLESDDLENAYALFSIGSRSYGYHLYDLYNDLLPRLPKNCPIFFTRRDNTIIDRLVPSLYRTEIETLLIDAGVLADFKTGTRSKLGDDARAARKFFEAKFGKLSEDEIGEERWWAIDSAIQYYSRVERSEAATASYRGGNARRFPTLGASSYPYAVATTMSGQQKTVRLKGVKSGSSRSSAKIYANSTSSRRSRASSSSVDPMRPQSRPRKRQRESTSGTPSQASSSGKSSRRGQGLCSGCHVNPKAASGIYCNLCRRDWRSNRDKLKKSGHSKIGGVPLPNTIGFKGAIDDDLLGMTDHQLDDEIHNCLTKAIHNLGDDSERWHGNRHRRKYDVVNWPFANLAIATITVGNARAIIQKLRNGEITVRKKKVEGKKTTNSYKSKSNEDSSEEDSAESDEDDSEEDESEEGESDGDENEEDDDEMKDLVVEDSDDSDSEIENSTDATSIQDVMDNKEEVEDSMADEDVSEEEDVEEEEEEEPPRKKTKKSQK